MSFHHLDRYADVPSPLTSVAPVARLLGTATVAVGAAVLPLGAWPQIAALLLLVAVLAALGRIPARVFLLRLAPPLAFVALVSVAVLALAPGRPLLRVGPIPITDAGLVRFGSTLGRGAAALGAATLLVSTTRFTEVVEALRALRLPDVVTTTLGLAYRFLYVLNDEVEQLRRAARSRNAAEGAVKRRTLLLGIAAAALTRSFARSERIHRAMLSRGYAGTMPSLDPHPLDGRSAAALAALAGVVAAVVVSAA